MQFLFWFSLLMIVYAYFGYALALMALDGYRRVIKRSGQRQDAGMNPSRQGGYSPPSVSLIITAYNEARRIDDKIKNTLELAYPRERLEIIIASDCSNDETDAIVRGYADRGIGLVRSPERKGKEHAQKLAVRAATGDILVFSDVATVLPPDAIDNIVRNFWDPSVGCVSSEDRFIDAGGRVSGEGLYVRYEMFLRALESRVNTLVGMSGSFFAARRDVCREWAPDLQSDFNTLLNAVQKGMKGVSDPRSVGYYENIADERKELQRKVRTVLRGITVLMRNRRLMNPFQYGMFAWQLFSHKLCRWLVPFFLLVALISNAMLLISGPVYPLLFILQLGFYIAAAGYWTRNRTAAAAASGPAGKGPAVGGRLRALRYQIERIAYYFLMVNVAIAWAWFRFFRGERATLWEPSKR